MFDLAWSEIALIGVVALVVIGPKDLPEAIRGVARGIQKLRRMAAEFQTHADELVREAKLDEVRNQINEVKSAVNEIRNFDLRTEIEKSVDADGSIRKTFEDDPLKPDWSGAGGPLVTPPPPAAEAPAFIPPDAMPPPAPMPPFAKAGAPQDPFAATAPLPPASDPLAATAPLPPASDPLAATAPLPPASDPLAASAPLPPPPDPLAASATPAATTEPRPAPVTQKA